MAFNHLFEDVFAHTPYDWQAWLGSADHCPNRLLRIPTGFGKTQGVLMAWAWNRVMRQDPSWPRRLIWCLPMRVLVEQTEAEIRATLVKLGLHWDGETDHAGKVGVHVLMGGVGSEAWQLYPEECAVLIGTQDMLLSRSLNRGYGAGRARWPMDFGLLNQDALWVMDEVQLMDVGVATSAQLQAFRHEDLARKKELRPCRTWWMSATLQPSWLRTVDTVAMLDGMSAAVEIPAESRHGGLWKVRKSLRIAQVNEDKAGAEVATIVKLAHQPGTLTLVVMNTVERAAAVYRQLGSMVREESVDLRLVHSRFRPSERESWRIDFLAKAAPIPAEGRIIVATQVVEAGVDLSARSLVTDMAPWSSLVQRFGRCARYEGEYGAVIVLDRGLRDKDEKKALPYDLNDLLQARNALAGLEDVSPTTLEAFEDQLKLAPDRLKALYPYQPLHLLLRREWEDLFDTAPDLSGTDLDISRFIRSGEEHDCMVFWRVITETGPSDDWTPAREELCPVPFLKVRDWLCGARSDGSEPKAIKRTKPQGSPFQRPVAWVWDYIDGNWKRDSVRRDLLPGRIVLVDSAFGGYAPGSGWDPDLSPAPPVPPRPATAEDRSDSSQEREDLSEAAWTPISAHGVAVGALAKALAGLVGLSPELANLMDTAGLWHDVGKAHRCFQGSIRLPGSRPLRQDLAKAPKAAWNRRNLYRSDSDPEEHRPGFRHELASALALFASLQDGNPSHGGLSPKAQEVFGASVQERPERGPVGWEQRFSAWDAHQFNLLAYLVVSHHGKVRLRLQASSKDQEYRDSDGLGMPIQGVREGDWLPDLAAPGGQVLVPGVRLSLEPALLGLSDKTGPSWTERTIELLSDHGPGALAFLEAVFRAADIRVSQTGTAPVEEQRP